MTKGKNGRAGDDTYEVGYCKPPRSAQFQKGKSGNPKGRPKGQSKKADKSDAMLAELILAAGSKEIQAQTSDGVTSMTMIEAIISSVAVKAAKGDSRAQKMFLDWFAMAERTQSSSASDDIGKIIADIMGKSHGLPRR